jgi:hypothetical protein
MDPLISQETNDERTKGISMEKEMEKGAYAMAKIRMQTANGSFSSLKA